MKRASVLAVLFFAVLLARCGGQSIILGKSPYDQWLASFFNQQNNSSNAVQGINAYHGTNTWADALMPADITTAAALNAASNSLVQQIVASMNGMVTNAFTGIFTNYGSEKFPNGIKIETSASGNGGFFADTLTVPNVFLDLSQFPNEVDYQNNGRIYGATNDSAGDLIAQGGAVTVEQFSKNGRLGSGGSVAWFTQNFPIGANADALTASGTPVFSIGTNGVAVNGVFSLNGNTNNPSISSDSVGSVKLTAGKPASLATTNGQVEVAPVTGGNVNRILNDKLGEIVSVMDYGATNDPNGAQSSINANTAAFQAVIDMNRTNVNPVVRGMYIPPGSYDVGLLNMTHMNGFIVSGVGKLQTFIYGVSNGPAVFDCTGANYMDFRDLSGQALTGFTAVPKSFILFARDGAGQGGAFNRMHEVNVIGGFTVANVYLDSSENGIFDGCIFQKDSSQTNPAACFYAAQGNTNIFSGASSNNLFAIQSTFSTNGIYPGGKAGNSLNNWRSCHFIELADTNLNSVPFVDEFSLTHTLLGCFTHVFGQTNQILLRNGTMGLNLSGCRQETGYTNYSMSGLYIVPDGNYYANVRSTSYLFPIQDSGVSTNVNWSLAGYWNGTNGQKNLSVGNLINSQVQAMGPYQLAGGTVVTNGTYNVQTNSLNNIWSGVLFGQLTGSAITGSTAFTTDFGIFNNNPLIQNGLGSFNGGVAIHGGTTIPLEVDTAFSVPATFSNSVSQNALNILVQGGGVGLQTVGANPFFIYTNVVVAGHLDVTNGLNVAAGGTTNNALGFFGPGNGLTGTIPSSSVLTNWANLYVTNEITSQIGIALASGGAVQIRSFGSGMIFYNTSSIIPLYTTGKQLLLDYLGILGFSAGPSSVFNYSTNDTAFSRLSQGVVAVGNGIQGDASGTIVALNSKITNSLANFNTTNNWLSGMGARTTNDVNRRAVDITLVGTSAVATAAYAQILVEELGPGGANGSTNTWHFQVPAGAIDTVTNTMSVWCNPGAVVTVTNLSGSGSSVTQIGSFLH